MGQVGANYKAKNRLPSIGASSNILDTFTMPVFDPSIGQNKEYTALISELRVLFKEPISAELSFSQNIPTDADVVFNTGTLTVNLPNPSIATTKIVTIRSISGTTTITADAGTVETDTLTTGQATTLVARATGWFEV